MGFNSVVGIHIVDDFIMKNMDHRYQDQLQFASYELLLSVMFTLWMKYIEKSILVKSQGKDLNINFDSTVFFGLFYPEQAFDKYWLNELASKQERRGSHI